MLQNHVKVDRQGETVFLNITLNNPEGAKAPVNASISTMLQNAIVDDPSSYRLIISRFSIPAKAIPLYFYQTLPFPNTNVNKGIYSVSIGYNNTYTAQVYLELIPESFQQPQVSTYSLESPNQSQQDSYYYMYSYQNLATMITKAIRAAIAAGAGFLPAAVDAYMTYQPSTGLFNLLGTQNMANSDNVFDPLNVSIWFNTPLANFFTGLRTTINTYNSLNGRDEMVSIVNLLNNSSATQDGSNPNIPVGYYQLTSEFNSDSSLQELARIIVVSNSFGGIASQSEVTPSNSGSYQNIIADFVPQASEAAGQYRSKFQYYAQSEFYRRTLMDKTPLNQLQFSFLWQGTSPNVYRNIILRPEDVLSIQFIFERI